MPVRYLICGKQLSCEDFNIIGTLDSSPKKNQEYVYRDIINSHIIHTRKKIRSILPGISNNVDLRLVLDDDTIVNIIVL